MSQYKITPYSFTQAKKLKVDIKPSSNPKKKVDVFRDGKKIASIGAKNFSDYGTYLETKGKAYADERRRLYKIRHENTRKVVGSNSWWADNLIW